MRGRARKNARKGQKRSGQGRERERTRREGGGLEGNRGRDREGQLPTPLHAFPKPYTLQPYTSHPFSESGTHILRCDEFV